MSNARPFRRRRLSSAQEQSARVLGPIDGARIPGGCDQCEAYQTVTPAAAGVWTVTVHHDRSCRRLPLR